MNPVPPAVYAFLESRPDARGHGRQYSPADLLAGKDAFSHYITHIRNGHVLKTKPNDFFVTGQTATKFEAFLRDFQRKNPSGTAKIPSRSDLEWDFRKLQYTPSIGRVL